WRNHLPGLYPHSVSRTACSCAHRRRTPARRTLYQPRRLYQPPRYRSRTVEPADPYRCLSVDRPHEVRADVGQTYGAFTRGGARVATARSLWQRTTYAVFAA